MVIDDLMGYNYNVYFYYRGGFIIFMKQRYICPDFKLVKFETQEILITSDEEVFVDGGNLFDD